jgi:hypothetical protein
MDETESYNLENDREYQLRLMMEEMAANPRTHAILNLIEIMDALTSDVGRAMQLQSDDPADAFARRALVRNVMTLVEGTVFAIKNLALETRGTMEGDLSVAELVLLLEDSYDLDDNGRTRTRINFLRVNSNLRFAFAILAKIHGIADSPLDVGGAGWQAFLRTVAVRNALTHPKKTGDLEVSDAAVSDAKETFSWFIVQFLALMMAILDERISAFSDPDKEKLKEVVRENLRAAFVSKQVPGI